MSGEKAKEITSSNILHFARESHWWGCWSLKWERTLTLLTTHVATIPRITGQDPGLKLAETSRHILSVRKSFFTWGSKFRAKIENAHHCNTTRTSKITKQIGGGENWQSEKRHHGWQRQRHLSRWSGPGGVVLGNLDRSLENTANEMLCHVMVDPSKIYSRWLMVHFKLIIDRKSPGSPKFAGPKKTRKSLG